VYPYRSAAWPLLNAVHCFRPLHVAAALLAAVTVLAAGNEREVRAQVVDPPCSIQTSERVIAIGDVHGAYDAFTGILRTAGLLDRRDRWIGGRAVLIQTGDVLDRGPESRRVIDLLRRLERDARRAGGQVIPLLGNHELMRLINDWRDVSDAEYRAFRRGDSEQLRERAHEISAGHVAERAQKENRRFDARAYREQFMADVPLGFVEMRIAFGVDGEYGRWVRERAAAARVNGVLFVHGGISEKVAALGCEGINEAIRADLDALPLPLEQALALLSSTENGPLWYRGLAMEPEETFAPTLDRILQQVGARAIVVGHTPVTRVTTRFGGRVVLIDTGMLGGASYPNGVASALEIHGDGLTAIYDDRREPLPAPALSAVAP
jgi:hypothetical protein